MSAIFELPTVLRLFLFGCLSIVLAIYIFCITILIISHRRVKSQILFTISYFIAILAMTISRTPLYGSITPIVFDIMNYLLIMPIIFGIIYLILKKDFVVILDIIAFTLNLPFFAKYVFWHKIYISSVGYFMVRSIVFAYYIYLDSKYDRGVYKIKEALETLSYGVLFANKKGQIIFINKQMSKYLYSIGIGKFLRINNIINSLKEFENVDRRLSKDSIVISLKNQTLNFILNKENKNVTQIICVDITEEEKILKELESTTKQLNLIQTDLKNTLNEIAKVEEEKEILRLRGNLHDTLSQRLSILHCFIIENKVDDIKQIKDLISSMLLEMYDNANLSFKDRKEQLVSSFAIIGVELKITGRLPLDSNKANFVLKAIRECTTNAVKHGQATSVIVNILKLESNKYSVSIKNDGKTIKEMNEGNGIKSIKYQLEQLGGSISISTFPQFKIDFIV